MAQQATAAAARQHSCMQGCRLQEGQLWPEPGQYPSSQDIPQAAQLRTCKISKGSKGVRSLADSCTYHTRTPQTIQPSSSRRLLGWDRRRKNLIVAEGFLFCACRPNQLLSHIWVAVCLLKLAVSRNGIQIGVLG